jgi:hypothetical protein
MGKPSASVLMLALIAILISGCINLTPNPPSANSSNSSNGSVDRSNAITQQMCEAAHGHWNGCGSACRGAPPGTACPMICVQYCECGGIAGFQCPPSYVCTDYLPSKSTPDAMGICKKVSD